MKRKIVTIVLCVVLGMTSLVGCGNNSDKNAGVKEGEVIEIDFWYSGGKTAVNVLAEIVDDFNNSQDVYKVNTVTQADYTETYEKLQAGIAGKKAPDLALLGSTSSSSLAQKNLVADFGAFIDADEDFDKEDYLDVFFRQGVDDNGKVYAMPAYGTTQIMYYNIAAFEEANIDPESIETWQDLADAAKLMTKPDGEFYGWEPMWGVYNLIDASFSNGATLLNEDGTEVLINTPAWVEVWESFRQWIHEDEIMTVHSGGQGWEYWYATIDDVLQNKAGGYTGSSGDQADLDFSIVGAMEQPGFGSNPSAPSAEPIQVVMLEGSSDAEKQGAYEFVKFFTSPENQAKWSMNTGYVAVRESTQEVPEFAAYVDENPHAVVPLQQAMHGSEAVYDPTGGKIMDALIIAADKVELENISAQEALDEAQKIAQEALDSL